MANNELLNQLNETITLAERMLAKSPKLDVVQGKAVDMVEGFLYSNIIINYRDNLTEDNLMELNITKEDAEKIKRELRGLFKRCEETLEAGFNKGKINAEVYQMFRNQVCEISKNASLLLLEFENAVDITSCEKKVEQFRERAKTLGKELKVGTAKFENGSLNISVGFDDD